MILAVEIEATKGSRNEIRDRCLLLLMFRHGLRVSEACGMKLDQVDTESRVLHVARLKGGLSTTHPLRGDELRAISAWLITAEPLLCPCSLIPTCCATLAASPWPTRALIRGSFRIISYIGIFSTPPSTRRPTRHGLKSCGAPEGGPDHPRLRYQEQVDGGSVQRLALLTDKERLAGRLHPGAFLRGACRNYSFKGPHTNQKDKRSFSY